MYEVGQIKRKQYLNSLKPFKTVLHGNFLGLPKLVHAVSCKVFISSSIATYDCYSLHQHISVKKDGYQQRQMNNTLETHGISLFNMVQLQWWC
jgi:hypothetical protein